jgi:diaminohydroxyphosphoribosylaminopyrimidine deaminase/5-amino-6-(5-phosphoribosylamino)uracil reductase
MNRSDQDWMRAALDLAMQGRGAVEPNPMVGCVIVKNGRMIGQGFHAAYGQPHAEPTALAACAESPAGATVYATLEPCCHYNKQTPPCVPRLIEAKVTRVVVGCLDPNPDVNGKGIAQLTEAGIKVDPPVLQDQARQLIAPFIARVVHRRPYVTLKWAESANGQVAGVAGRAVRITNLASDRVIHALRARCDAIAVGTNTLLNDDPLLTARGVESQRGRPLLRVVLSNSLKIPLQSRLVKTAREQPVIVYTTSSDEQAKGTIAAAGVTIITLPARADSRFSFADVMTDLHERGVTHLLVEPGPTLTRYFLERGQADRVWVFRSSSEIEDARGFATSYAPAIKYPETGRVDLDSDTLTEYLNPNSDVYFACDASADLELARQSNVALR